MVASNNSINNTIGASISGATNSLTITNPSNTASSSARELITVGGASAGDPLTTWTVDSTTTWSLGIDNSDGDSLKINNSSALGSGDCWVMTTAGQRTLPLQSVFSCTSSGTVSNVTGDGTIYPIINDNVSLNINSNYSGGTGVYTAPVDGIYYFFLRSQFSVTSFSFTSAIIGLLKNGSSVATYQNMKPYYVRTSSNNVVWEGMEIIELTAADTIQPYIQVSGGSKTVQRQGGNFQGGLLY